MAWAVEIIQIAIFLLVFSYCILSLYYFDNWEMHICSDLAFYMGVPVSVAALFLLTQSTQAGAFAPVLFFIPFCTVLWWAYRKGVIFALYMGATACVPVVGAQRVIISAFSIFGEGTANEMQAQVSVLLAVLAGGMVFALFFRAVLRQNIDSIRQSKKFIWLVGVQMFILGYLFFVPRLYQGESFRVSIQVGQMITCLLLTALSYFVLYFGIRGIRAAEQSEQNKTLRRLIWQQGLHYKAYQNHVEELSRFRQEYKTLTHAINQYMEKGKTEKIKETLGEINSLAQKRIFSHKEYANSPLIDALLQNSADTCKEQNIRFKAGVFLPASVRAHEIALCEVLFDMFAFLQKMIEKTKDGQEKFFQARSSSNKNWATVKITASFGGELLYKENNWLFRYRGQDVEAFPLQATRGRLADMGGGLEFEVNKEEQTMSIHLHFKMQEEGTKRHTKENLVRFTNDTSSEN